MILLVRHPAVAAGGRCYGRLDLPLADPASAGALAGRVVSLMPVLRLGVWGTPPPSPLPQGEGERVVWTSPARRCREVAEIIGVHRADERLQELDFGAWEGMAWDDVPRDSLDAWGRDPWAFAPPGGESGRQLVERVEAFAAECLRDGDAVITHGGPLRVLVSILAGRAVRLLDPPPAVDTVTVAEDDRLTPR